MGSSIPAIEYRREKQRELLAFFTSLNLRAPLFQHIEDGATLELFDIERDTAGNPVVKGNPPHYFDLPLIGLRPDGSTLTFPVRLNKNSAVSNGSVIVPILKHGDVQHIVAVRQFRFPLQRWTLEFPRGFAETEAGTDTRTVDVPGIGHLRIEPLLRELYEEALQANIKPSVVRHLGRLEENSSTHLVAPDFISVLFDIESGLESALGGEQKLPVVLLSPQEVERRLGIPGPDGINDLHSVGAWGLLRKWVEFS